MKENSFKTPSGNTINIYRAKTDFVRGRDWAMGKGEELIKKKLAAAKLTVPVQYEAAARAVRPPLLQQSVKLAHRGRRSTEAVLRRGRCRS